MSKKKNKKKPNLTLVNNKLSEKVKNASTPVLSLMPPKESVMEQMSKMLFTDFFTNYLKLKTSLETEDIEIIAFYEDGTSPDIICRYDIIPASNKKVKISVEPKSIKVQLDKKDITMTDKALEYLAANSIEYMKRYIDFEHDAQVNFS